MTLPSFLTQASTSSSDPFGFGGGGGVLTGVLDMLISGGSYRRSAQGFSQIPQLSSAQPFDINRCVQTHTHTHTHPPSLPLTHTPSLSPTHTPSTTRFPSVSPGHLCCSCLLMQLTPCLESLNTTNATIKSAKKQVARANTWLKASSKRARRQEAKPQRVKQRGSKEEGGGNVQSLQTVGRNQAGKCECCAPITVSA